MRINKHVFFCNYLILVGIIFFSCQKVDEEFFNFNDKFDTKGYVKYKETEYPLDYGNITILENSKNTKTYRLSILYLDIFYNEVKAEITSNYLGFDLDIHSTNTEQIAEGNYHIDTLNSKQSFSITDARFYFNDSGNSSENNGIHKIKKGEFIIHSSNVYPHSGFKSIIIKATFLFRLENNEELEGKYVGRLLVLNNPEIDS